MDAKNKILEVATLLGLRDSIKEEMLVVDEPEYTFTLRSMREGNTLEAEITFKRHVPLAVMDKAAEKLIHANFRVALSGFYLDEYGNYGQRHEFSVLEENENVAYSVFVLLRELSNYLINT